MNKPDTSNTAAPSNFIRTIIDGDLESGKHQSIMTRFPPEPNGYLHIGHAKSICLNFGLARDYRGQCNLRFDDTNPTKEDIEYVESIKEDVRWLGFDWNDGLYFASDYFEQLYEYAIQLIKDDKAYVCSLNADQVRETRGTLTEPGTNSPYRERSVEENLELFEKMRKGEFEDGAHTLRAKIDMASPNLNLRDPALYRIRHAHHHRTGDDWCIYPMYDYAHGLSDAIEGVTHSICTLEFEDHRPLYDWFLKVLPVPHTPRQIEFARLNLAYTITSKRKLLRLVEEGIVSGWDDPRMPTLAGIRRLGYTPEAIRDFCERIGVAKAASVVDPALLEHCVREDLNQRAHRGMAVLDPLKVVIENYPEGQVEEFDVPWSQNDESAGLRKVPFSKELYIEKDDFMEVPEKKFFRLSPGKEVRFMNAYYLTCTGVEKDAETGEVVEVRCTYDPETRGGWGEGFRKVKGTLHWVSAAHAVPAELRLYDRLFTVENPNDGDDFTTFLNKDSLQIIENALLEPALLNSSAERFQFLRQGYFYKDPQDYSSGKPVFNRIVPLKDSWGKLKGK